MGWKPEDTDHLVWGKSAPRAPLAQHMIATGACGAGAGGAACLEWVLDSAEKTLLAYGLISDREDGFPSRGAFDAFWPNIPREGMRPLQRACERLGGVRSVGSWACGVGRGADFPLRLRRALLREALGALPRFAGDQASVNLLFTGRMPLVNSISTTPS